MRIFPALSLFLAISVSMTTHCEAASKTGKVSKAPKVKGSFQHGLASGSPLPTAMIFWTRYTPIDGTTSPVEIEYRIAKVPEGGMEVMDEHDFGKLLSGKDVRYGLAMATPENDWVIKLDITGLTPGSTYVYGFTDGYTTTEVGKTKTPPSDGASLDSMTFAVFSCANFTGGYFHAYDVASTIEDLDFWYHAGDYIYEYGNDICENGRCWEPTQDIVSLDDYRRRYASYHLDEGLKNLRRSAPLISTWDDHETANNAAVTGAQNHDPSTQGLWSDRVKAGKQAYLEWMPFRESQETGIVGLPTQTFEFGDLMTFVTVDTRIRARSLDPALHEQASIEAFAAATFLNGDTSLYGSEPLLSVFNGIAESVKSAQYDPSYEMMGQDQIDFIAETFQKSSNAGKPWQIFGDQTKMGKDLIPCLSDYYTYFPSEAQPIVKAVVDSTISQTPPSLLVASVRAVCAMVVTNTPWGRDDWNGYANERKKLLDVMSKNATNPIILFGDSHDSWAFQVDNDGGLSGAPVAVNIGTPGVTSVGLGSLLRELFVGLQGALLQNGFQFSLQDLNDFFSALYTSTNDNLVFSNVYNKGFLTVNLARDWSKTEFYGLSSETLALDFDTARAANNGSITGEYFCTTSLLTKADQQSSLQKQECGATKFAVQRPAYWNASFKHQFMSKTRKN